VRYLLASVPYKKGLNFTFDGLQSARTAIDRVRNFNLRLDTAKLADGTNEGLQNQAMNSIAQFCEAMDDDLNTAEALAAVFEYIREANTAIDSGEFKAGNVRETRNLLAHFDQVFDVLKPSQPAGGISEGEVDGLIAERTAAKKTRDFAKADGIRKELLEKGVILEDTKDGVRWKWK
jgi:cysteinyl-tRNA synthetase